MAEIVESEVLVTKGKLTKALVQAAGGGKSEARLFFEELLLSSVFVPLVEGKAGSGKDPGKVFFEFAHEGKSAIPIFSELELLQNWAGRELAYQEKNFKSLLLGVPGSVWIYLNPAAECGKELSPWEISRLAKGTDAIEEILSELEIEESEEYEFEEALGEDLLKAKLVFLLESYPDVEEAFFLSFRVRGDTEFRPAIGLRHSGLDAATYSRLTEEIAELVQRETQKNAAIVELGSEDTPFQGLFRDHTPFFYRPKPKVAESIFQRLKGKWFRS